jgi:hypothetical protein
MSASIATAHAVPSGMVVRDDRFADIGMTPSLGRGYSLSANSMHSVCFETLPTTRASFDFDFELEELDEDARAAVRGEVADFVRDTAARRTVGEGAARRHVHYLLATLTVESYYSSIDESAARLSAGTMALLHAGDMLAFFGGCGTHYLRSISRRSHYLTLFSYTSAERTRDPAFERRLDHLVQRFDADGASSAEDEEAARQFDVEARSRSLRTLSRSIGLVAQDDGRLLPFDLSAYRGAVAGAFKAAQDENVGRVTAVELAPWLSNPTVLAALDSSVNTVGAEHGTYARRQRLAENADVYVEMVERVRRLESLVHRANQCRRALDAEVLDDDGAVRPEHQHALVRNHRSNARVPLATLVAALTDEGIALLEAAVRADTSPAADRGAGRCIADLEQGQLVAESHRALPACATPFPRVPHGTTIDDLCMPELVEAQATTPATGAPRRSSWISRVIFRRGA